VGLIALATTGAALLMHGAGALAGMNAGATSRALVDSLRAVPCLSIVSGSANSGPTSATWGVTNTGPVRRITSNVTAAARHAATARAETGIPCQ
jgi:hypothetical protein